MRSNRRGSRAGRRSIPLLPLLGLAVVMSTLFVGCADEGESSSGTGDAGGAQRTHTADEEPPGSRPTTAEELEAMSDRDLAEATYVAGYPLVVSMRTLQHLGGLIGTNQLFWQTELSGPHSRIIVAPNRDTLYSVAVVDLRAGPVVLTLPEVADRYHTYQLLSPWTDSFAYIGSRATGGRAGSWVITPPGWAGDVPDGAELIESPTSQLMLLGRFLVDDEADVDEVLAIRDASSLRPLDVITGTEATPEPPELGTPAGPAQEVPEDATFYRELATFLADNPPPTEYQEALFAAAERRLGGVDSDVLSSGAAAGAARIAEAIEEREEPESGWWMDLDLGTYGDAIDLRAQVARVGWGANVPEEALYPIAWVDSEGGSLDGSDGRAYTVSFEPGALPRLDTLGFWSLSAYGDDMFFAPHPSDRYAIGDRSPELEVAPDGSTTLILSHAEPETGAAGWLPVPDGPFVLMLRLYLPTVEIRDGNWTPPPVELVPTP